MISVHDNNIYAYSVNCEEQRITLHTSFEDVEPRELTDIVFIGVVAHSFENVLPANILFDVNEIEPQSIVQQYADRFQESWRYGWPDIEYNGDLELLEKLLRERSVKGFAIHSSFGLSGWVLATNCERIARPANSGEVSAVDF